MTRSYCIYVEFGSEAPANLFKFVSLVGGTIAIPYNNGILNR